MKKLVLFLIIFFCAVAIPSTYIRGPRLIEGVTVTAKAAGTTTLTASSETNQFFTGVAAQTVKLPDATTLDVGTRFYIANKSGNTLTIVDNGSNTLASVYQPREVVAVLSANGTSNGTWRITDNTITLTASYISGILPIANGGTGQSSFSSGLIKSDGAVLSSGQADLTSNVTGILPIANGGTNSNSTPTLGAVAFGTGTSFSFSNVGSAGQILQSNGASMPLWSTATYPTDFAAPALMVGNTSSQFTTISASTANRVLRTNGTALSFSQVALGTDVSGTLGTANGGTGTASAGTQYGLPYYSTTTAMASTAAGTSTQVLHGNASGAPTWSAVSLTADVTGTLPIANGGTNSTATPTNGGVAYGDGSAVQYSSAGSTDQLLVSAGAAAPVWLVRDGADTINNCTIATSVASSALTIAIKGKNGSDPSSTNPCKISMRSSSATTGTYTLRTVSGALSLVVSSGSTLGQTSNKKARLFVYLIDNAGTIELAVSQTLYDENQLITTTAEGGAGAADSATVVYSTTARSNVAFRLIGVIDNTQTTAGTWASAGSLLANGNYGSLNSKQSAIRYYLTTGSATTTITGANQNIDFNTSEYDYLSEVSGTGGSSWVFTASSSGLYDIYCQVMVTGSTAFNGTTESIEMTIEKNGTTVTYQSWTPPSGAWLMTFSVKSTQRLAGGDTVNCDMVQFSGSNHNITLVSGAVDSDRNFIEIRKVANF